MKKFVRWPFRGKRKFFTIGLLLVVLIGWFLFGRGPKTEALQYHTVTRQTITSTVSASGELAGRDTANLKFPSSGRIASLRVKEGDRVVRGQVIGTLDAQELSIALQQARNTLREKEAALEKVLDDVKDHSGDETFAQKQARTTAEVAKDNAYENVRAAERALRNATLISPISGVATQVNFIAGQTVSAADSIAQISDDSETYFDAEVDEADIGKVALKQKAEIEFNSYPEKKFVGEVTRIVPHTETSSSGATIVLVRINLGKTDINFVPGISGQATIITQELTNVLSVPQDALAQESKVYKEVNGKVELIDVKTGMESDNDIEILEGLSENDRVVVNPQVVPSPTTSKGFSVKLGRN